MANPEQHVQPEKAPWMEQTLAKQLSRERDFKVQAPTVAFQYAILCGHRMGSNLLSEALYGTGMAGDPMEFFNLRLLKRLYEQRDVKSIPFPLYIQEMKARRTSPNGVFGFNIKVDQFVNYFEHNHMAGLKFIKDCDYVIFLYRKDKIKQAISVYIGQQRDTFRIPADADYSKIEEIVSTVPFNPTVISNILHNLIKQEQAWVRLLHTNNIPHEKLIYEDFIKDYEDTIDRILHRIGVPPADRKIPPMPTMKVSTFRNEEFKEQFMALLTGEKSMADLLPADIPE
ncbi:MAG: Stf0 sulfotransferase family protein [Gammaproteobacteria bacterium]|nr:Stf0 sulfotransferase family protein [Gammaproteobacteria bacterium]